MGGRGIRQRFAHVRVKLGQSVRVSTHIVEAAEALGAVGRQIAALTCAHSRFAGSTPTAVGRAACTQAHARREQHEEAYPHVHYALNSPAGAHSRRERDGKHRGTGTGTGTGGGEGWLVRSGGVMYEISPGHRQTLSQHRQTPGLKQS